MVQDCFDSKPLPQEFSYKILFLIPKLELGKYHGIVLLEVMDKVISMIIHICINDQIQFHLEIHSFHHKRGKGMCILEAKLDMQLASYLCQPLYQIYLDLTKAYDTLDCKCALSLLKAYGLGPNTHSLIESVWEWELLVPKSSDCFGNSFHAHWGIQQQGDVISPVIFNIIVNALFVNGLLVWMPPF